MSVNINARPSGYIGPKTMVAPQEITANNVTSTYTALSAAFRWAILLALGSVHADADITVEALQATAADGTGAKVLQINGADSVAYNAGDQDNTARVLDLAQPDVENGFTHVAVKVTVAGALAPVLVAAVLLGVEPRNETPGNTTV